MPQWQSDVKKKREGMKKGWLVDQGAVALRNEGVLKRMGRFGSLPCVRQIKEYTSVHIHP